LSKGGSNVTQAESWSDIPERYRDFVDENLSLAGTLGNRAYTPYQGQRVAGFTGDQNAAFNTVRQLPNQYGGMVANANQALTNAATPVQPQGYNPATFQASQAQAALMPSAQGYDAAVRPRRTWRSYQNPYTEQVIDAGLNDLNRSYQMSLSGIGARAAGAGAYGGSRQGVAEAEAAKNFMDSAGQLSAGLRSQGFNTAAGLGQGDAASQNASRQFGAGSQNAQASQNSQLATQAALANAASQNAALEASANAMNQSGQFNAQQANAIGQQNVANQLAAGQAFGGLAGTTQTLGMNSANALAGIGQQQQGLNQAQMDLNYGDFLQEYNYPYQALALRQSAIGQTPMGQVGMQPVVSQSAGIGGTLSGIGGLLSGIGALCWVAREVYGEDDPQWLRFREWMLSKAPDSLRRFYIENGERIAAYISDKPDLKSEIRGMMDELVPGVAS
jgi:hypothetical protein